MKVKVRDSEYVCSTQTTCKGFKLQLFRFLSDYESVHVRFAKSGSGLRENSGQSACE